jgi:hypothetical protein
MNLDHHPIGVDIGDPQARDFGGAQPCGIGRGQRGTSLERR